MKASECVLVIPSIREINPDYLRFVPDEVKILVVDDSDGTIKPNRKNMEVFDYSFQRKIMGRDYDLIPHKTAACRNFAFYYIWKHTDYKYVLSLDDDCKTREHFMQQYSVLGQRLELDTVIAPGWFNTIDLFKLTSKIYARGYPYFERHEQKSESRKTTGRVAFHMGMWDKVLDTNALDKHLFKEYSQIYRNCVLRKRIIRIGTSRHPVKFPFSAMNFGFIRELLPIVYQFPMQESFTDRYSLWRYDDIWAGYVMQSLIALKKDAVTIGAPVIEHAKFGNLWKEMLGEHFGYLMSPYFYAIVDDAARNIPVASYAEMYADLFGYILKNAKKIKTRYQVPDLCWSYIYTTSSKLHRWGKLFLDA
ncbi:MAG: hypothetical protein WCG78_05215 [Candidatus Omnitrophota bacterium]